MNNYKIRVNNEAESREAQELFFELGYAWHSGKHYLKLDSGCTHLTVYSDGALTMGSDDSEKELTLPQLRDLAVLHRNDIDDANWETEGYDQIYEDSSGKSFIFRERGWDELQRHEMRQAMWKKTKPKPQTIENEQGLISGADALRALADGEEVEFFDTRDSLKKLGWCDASGNQAWLFLRDDSCYKYRLKPRTVKLEIEVPAPFEPKEGEKYYFLSSNGYGYDGTTFSNDDLDKEHLMFGAWRTEAEIKIVVEQFRKIKELSK